MNIESLSSPWGVVAILERTNRTIPRNKYVDDLIERDEADTALNSLAQLG